jgi:hypothetical protein
MLIGEMKDHNIDHDLIYEKKSWMKNKANELEKKIPTTLNTQSEPSVKGKKRF